MPPAVTEAARPVPLRRDPVLMVLLVAGVGLCGWFALDLAGARTQLVLGWTVAPVMDVLLFWLCHQVCRLPGLPADTRRFWRAISLAGLTFFAGDVALLVTILGDPSLDRTGTHPVQTATALFGVIMVYAVGVMHPLGIWRRGDRVRFVMDAAIVNSAAVVIAWCLMTRPNLVSLGSADYITALVGCGVMLCGVLLSVKMVLSGNSPVLGAAAVPLGLSLVLQAAANAVLPSAAAMHSGVQMVVAVAPGMVVLAAPRIQLLRFGTGRSAGAAGRANSRRRYSVLPYAATVICAAALVAALLSGGLGLPAWGALAGLLVNVALVVARQLLALAENNRLLGRLDERERRLESLLRHASEITSISGPDGEFRYLSPAVEKVLGIPVPVALGRNWLETLHAEDRARLAPDLEVLHSTPGAQLTYQGRYRRADGSWRWLEVVAVNLTHEPAIGGVVSNSRDITESRELHERLTFQAGHDDLTGLANRRQFTAALAATAGDDGGGRASVLLIDLNGFKQINDTYGHGAGDAVLRHVAERLLSCAGPGDVPARLGGDEFAVLAADPAAAEGLAGRIRAALAEPAVIAGRELAVGVSIGVATGAACDPDQLLNAADLRMYDEKQRSRAVPS
ncbi:diguanylate cyclase domain-containing protein [Actinoplanes sp. GCM10030250]|uniref:diguanylate cyclase domain-containing protein n=1 Tax=Actinoplanes sp. GCM10030250 TaxID=3273376 RepID=UPI0036153274